MEKKWRFSFLKITKALFTASFFWLLSNAASAQIPDSTRLWQQVTQISVAATQITSDPLQNLYLLTANGELQKYNTKGQLLFKYNNQNLGAPAHIDATNPLRILLHYPDYLTTIVLDRTLNELYVYNLLNYGFNQVNAITTSPDNGLWLYDEWTYQFKKINQHGETVISSNDLSQVLNVQLAPSQILFQNNNIYLCDEEEGIFVFDFYGQFLAKIPLIGIHNLQIQGAKITYLENQQLKIFNLLKSTTTIFSLPTLSQPLQALRIEEKHLFLLTNNSVFIFNFE